MEGLTFESKQTNFLDGDNVLALISCINETLWDLRIPDISSPRFTGKDGKGKDITQTTKIRHLTSDFMTVNLGNEELEVQVVKIDPGLT